MKFFLVSCLCFFNFLHAYSRVYRLLEDVDSVELLSGGYSLADNFLVDGRYVLKMYESDCEELDAAREFHALSVASDLGIGPKVHKIFLDQRSILVDYVKGGTLTTRDAKSPHCIKSMAAALRKLHGGPKNPHARYRYNEKIDRIFWLISKAVVTINEYRESIDLVRRGLKELGSLEFEKVTIHGDLNPRNIFLRKEGILLIDWSETDFDHPFYDVSGFTVLHDYSDEAEMELLRLYLGRAPSSDELRQFNLVKRINLAKLARTCFAIGADLQAMDPQEIDPDASLKEWSYYVSTFSDPKSDLSAQFFSECGRSALEYAKSKQLFEQIAQL
jgi:thiamine kinase-like enzyme